MISPASFADLNILHSFRFFSSILFFNFFLLFLSGPYVPFLECLFNLPYPFCLVKPFLSFFVKNIKSISLLNLLIK